MPAASTARLAPAETRLGLRLFLFHAGLIGAWYAVGMPANAIVSGFALKILGVSEENVGLIGAVLYSAAVFQFLSFAITNRVRDRKRFMLLVGGGEMVFMAMLGLVPLLFDPGSRTAWMVFLGFLFLSGTCFHLTQPILESWISALVPPRLRGRYLGSRRLVTTLVQTGAVWVGLRIVGRWPTEAGFSSVLLMCALAGLGALALLRRSPMPAVSRASHFRLRAFRGVLRHDPFRRYLVFILTLFSAFALACSYYSPFFLEEVGLSFQQVGWYVIGHNILMIAVLRPVGHLVDRIGARPVISMMVVIYAVFFLSFPLFSRERYGLIVFFWSLVGIADGAFWVAVPSILYHSLPKGPERTGFLAAAQGLVMLCMGVGPFLVRAYLQVSAGLHFTVLGVTVERFRLMFFGCGLLMLGALLAARRLDNTRDGRVSQVVAIMLRTAPQRLLPRFWRIDPRNTNGRD